MKTIVVLLSALLLSACVRNGLGTYDDPFYRYDKTKPSKITIYNPDGTKEVLTFNQR